MTAEAEIRRRIAANGPITFAEFMEVALYWPGGGYYAAREPVGGDDGDYYTSPLAHPCFGALLAVQLFQMWRIMGRPTSFTVVEWGAGNGLLCRDVLRYARQLPDGFVHGLRYVCVDRRESPGHEQGMGRAERLVASGLPLRGIIGCVLSNELLDAFPVHQVRMQDRKLREVFVGLNDGELATVAGDPSTPKLAERLDSLGITLAEGQTAEVNLGLDAWAGEVSGALERGFVLTIDYGRPAKELYSDVDRRRGALTTFHRHLQTDEPLERVGQQDMSSQVDFTSVVRAGERAGLRFLDALPQGAFLRNLGLPAMLARLREASDSQTEYVANRNGMMELVKPGGLGDFQVLTQGKNVGQPTLWGSEQSDEAEELAASLPAPKLTGRHLDLRRGMWPG